MSETNEVRDGEDRRSGDVRRRARALARKLARGVWPGTSAAAIGPTAERWASEIALAFAVERADALRFAADESAHDGATARRGGTWLADVFAKLAGEIEDAVVLANRDMGFLFPSKLATVADLAGRSNGGNFADDFPPSRGVGRGYDAIVVDEVSDLRGGAVAAAMRGETPHSGPRARMPESIPAEDRETLAKHGTMFPGVLERTDAPAAPSGSDGGATTVRAWAVYSRGDLLGFDGSENLVVTRTRESARQFGDNPVAVTIVPDGSLVELVDAGPPQPGRDAFVRDVGRVLGHASGRDAMRRANVSAECGETGSLATELGRAWDATFAPKPVFGIEDVDRMAADLFDKMAARPTKVVVRSVIEGAAIRDALRVKTGPGESACLLGFPIEVDPLMQPNVIEFRRSPPLSKSPVYGAEIDEVVARFEMRAQAGEP